MVKVFYNALCQYCGIFAEKTVGPEKELLLANDSEAASFLGKGPKQTTERRQLLGDRFLIRKIEGRCYGTAQ
jgi:hypothetical protein